MDQQLLPHLSGLEERPGATPRQKVISEIMSGVEKTRIDTRAQPARHPRQGPRDQRRPRGHHARLHALPGLRGAAAEDGREGQRRRPVLHAPRGDPGHGPGRCAEGRRELETLKRRTFYGREKDNLIYPIALANLVLHDIDEPHVWHGNTLTGAETYGGLFADAPGLYDVVLMNPPFGGKEGQDAQTRFAYKTSATQVLFLQHVIDSLKPGGRCGIVIDEGVLFRTNETAFVQTKRKLLDECDLWCLVSLPAGAFVNAGAGVKTNLLFFTKGQPTERVWYYDLSGVKVGKKSPLTLGHFEELFRLLPARADSPSSWTVERPALEAKGLDLKAVNPNAKNDQDKRTPEELLDTIEAKGREVAEAVARLRELTRRST